MMRARFATLMWTGTLAASVLAPIGGFACVLAQSPAAGGESSLPELKPREPGALSAAKPMTVYRAQCQRAKALDQEGSTAGDPIRYQVRLPEGFEASKPTTLLVVLHPQGKTVDWTFATYDAKSFRTRDVVIAMESTTITDDGERVFAPRTQDAVPMRDALLDFSRAYPTAKIILVGHEDAGRFVLAFAAGFPRLIDGVVAVRSGMLDRTPTRGGVSGLPVVFVHSPKDAGVAYVMSVDARDAFRKDEHPTATLRRGSATDAKVVGEAEGVSDAVEYIQGITARTPGEALLACERLLRPRSLDELQRSDSGIPFGMAREILRRFEAEKPKEDAKQEPEKREDGMIPPPKFDVTRKFKDLPDEERKRAFELSVKIEQHAQQHARVIRQAVQSSGGIKLGASSAWIGHVSALREDFRGVESIEELVKELRIDEQYEAARDSGDVIRSAFAEEKPPEQVFRAVVEQLPSALLDDALPAGMEKAMTDWAKDSERAGIDAELLKAFESVKVYFDCRRAGLKTYHGLLAGWSLER